MHRRSIGEDWFVEAPRGFPLDSSWWPTYETTFAFFDRVLTDDKTINLENPSPVFFHPILSAMKAKREHTRLGRIFVERCALLRKWGETRAPFTFPPLINYWRKEASALFVARIKTRCLCSKIYTRELCVRIGETSNRKTRLICL